MFLLEWFAYEVAEQKVVDNRLPSSSPVPTRDVKLLVTTPMILSGYLYWGGVLLRGE